MFINIYMLVTNLEKLGNKKISSFYLNIFNFTTFLLFFFLMILLHNG